MGLLEHPVRQAGTVSAWHGAWTQTEKNGRRNNMRKTPDIVQIIPAQGMEAIFGRREIKRDGTMKKQITETRPVICWALVSDDEMYVVGMVALASGEIMIASQRDDFLEYETATQPNAPSNRCEPRHGVTVEDVQRSMAKVEERIREAAGKSAGMSLEEYLKRCTALVTTVSRRGIKVNGQYLTSPALLMWCGAKVKVLPKEQHAAVYTIDGEYITSISY